MSLLTHYGAYDGAWLMQQDFPPTRYVVDGLIPEGLTYIIAAPKIGKSWMVLDLALAVTQGVPFLGAIPVEQRPVLYIALEDGPKRMQGRARALQCYDLPETIAFVHRVKPEHATGLMREFMALHAGEEPLVILDTLGKIKPGKAPGEGAYEHDYQVSAGLKEIADDAGGSVIVVHHNRKAGSDDFLEDVSGTQGIAGAADTIIVIRRPRTSPEGELHITSRDATEGSYAVSFNDGKWTLEGANLTEASQVLGERQETKNMGDLKSSVLAFVNSRPDGTRAADVSAALGCDDATARQNLTRLEKANSITKQGRGLYMPVTTVTSVTNTETVPS